MTATITFAGGISGIGHFNRHSLDSRFIFHERPQLPERPTSQNCPLRLPNLYPVDNSAQVFKSDTPSGAFGCRNNLLRNTMIHVAGKASFLARQFTKPPTRRLRLKLLKFGSEAALSVAHSLDRFPAVMPAVRVACNLRDTEIYAEEIVRVSGFRLLDIASSRQEPITAMEQKIGFSLAVRQQSQLALSRRECDFDAPGQSSERDCLFIGMPCQVSIIERQTTERLKSALCFLVQLVGVRHLRRTADGYLGWDSKVLAQISARKFLERVLAKCLVSHA